MVDLAGEVAAGAGSYITNKMDISGAGAGGVIGSGSVGTATSEPTVVQQPTPLVVVPDGE
jgi:hypothetical protein